MSPSARPPHGGCPLFRTRRARAFTLLEMCIVLLVIALLFGVTAPAIQSAFVEQGLRGDANELALLVKTGMLKSTEQHRTYLLDLTSSSMSLHPASDDTPSGDTDASSDQPSNAINVSEPLHGPNQLQVPNPGKPRAWMAMPKTSWLFQPGELCPAVRVRIVRGDSAYVEQGFNALTGNIEDEASSIP